MKDNSSIIISILERLNIPYWASGKNVSENSINIQCPFKDCDDPSNHCGIFKDSLLFHCWKCGRRGSFAFLLVVITGHNFKECQEEIESLGITFQTDILEQAKEILEGEDSKDECSKEEKNVELPKYFEFITRETESDLLESYLKRRKVSRETLIEYNVGMCRVGEFMNRLIIPVYFEGKLVSFQAADMTGRAELKYKTAVSKVKNYFFGWDRLPQNPRLVVLVEGILDAWRLENGVLATFGTSLTDRQRHLLVELHPSCLVFCWDEDAWLHSCKEAENLRAFLDRVEVVQLPAQEDPDSYGKENTWKLILEAVGNE